MSKIFTRIQKYSFLIILVVAILQTISLSASAEEYKSMIRYDRVWECICINDGDCHGHPVLKCMRFDGQDVIDGKVYHRIATIKKAFLSYHSETETTTYEVIDCYEPEGYLREEDGVVYTLVAEHEVGTYSNGEPRYHGEPYISGKNNDENSICREYVLYDFNVKQDDFYNSVSFVYGSGSKLDTFKVLNLSTIEIEGEECRMMYVCPERDVEDYLKYDIPYYRYQPIVEGIGSVDCGCLNYHELIDWPTKMYAHHYFSRLFDMDGKVIYPLDCPENDIDYGPFTSVGSISSLTIPKDTSMYDMMGRRISTPAPGQLYIQDGKKRIAPIY